MINGLQFSARRRAALSFAVASALVCGWTATPGAARAESAPRYPSKPVQIVVPYAPGGSADFSARQIATRLQERLGQPFTIVNRPGASGEIGVESVTRSPADGYTLLLALNTELVILQQLGRKLSYSLDQLTPVSLVGSTPLVLIGKKAFKADRFPELLEEIRPDSGRYSFGGAPGSPAHITGEWFNQQAHLKMEHVPYKGGAQAVNDVAGGHLDLYFSGITPALSLIKSGAVKAFVTTNRTRSALLPNVPTMQESGFRNFVVGNWTALLAPAGTPPAIVALIKHHVEEILADRTLQQAMQQQGIEPPPTGAPATFIAQEQEKYRTLIQSLQLKLE
jgi:tripartite-type tricarboxylate transporter receptor subunit TctC